MEQFSTDTVKKLGSPNKSPAKSPIVMGVLAIALTAAGFVSGMQYQKGTTTTTATTGTAMQAGANMQGQMGVVGQVTAISSTSITVNDQRTSSTTAYAISSSTTVTNDSASASVSDIQVGDQVMIAPSTSDSKTAARIVINPTMGGPTGATSTTQSQTN